MMLNSKKQLKIIYGINSKRTQNKIFVNESDFDSPLWQQITEPPILLASIQNSKHNNKKIPELFLYNDISLYWFFYPFLYAEIKNTTSFLTKFIKFIEDEKPELVKITDDFRTFDIIKQICNQKEIKFQYSKLLFLKYYLRKKIGRHIRKYRLQKMTELKIKKRRELHLTKFGNIPNLDNKILFVSADIYRRFVVNLEKHVIEKGEYILQDILRYFSKKENIIGISVDYDVNFNLTNFIERLQSELEWIPVELLFDHSKKSNHDTFFKNYNNIISDKNFHELFKFNNILIWSQIENVFEQMKYCPYLPFWLKLIDSLTIIFSTKKPKSVFLLYETGPLALAFITVCNQLNIKTIGIQHGIIAENWKYYTISPLQSSTNPHGFPLPTYMLLFGNFSKNILLKNGYPEKQLFIFGNPVFFELNEKELILTKTNLYTKYKINNQKKIILFTTIMLEKEYASLLGDYDYNIQIWQKLLKNFSGKKDVIIILKPHPGESITRYKKLLEEYDSSNVIIADDNILELIYISTVVVSMFSSILIDSLCLKKPVIEVNFDNVKSPLQLSQLGAVIETNLSNLPKTILDLLYDDELKNILIRNGKIVIKEIYNIPEENPASLIQRLLEN